MKLLLCKNVGHLGIVGDVVNVSDGYARNYLLPHGLATEPSVANTRRLAKARKQAEIELAKHRAVLDELGRRLVGVEVTIPARTNESGVLYGSVGKKEIAAALQAEGYGVQAEQVVLAHPIRQLDNLEIDIRLAADLRTPVKVWVVREKSPEEAEAEKTEKPEATKADTEVGDHGRPRAK